MLSTYGNNDENFAKKILILIVLLIILAFVFHKHLKASKIMIKSKKNERIIFIDKIKNT